jgi:hypothetical protein
MEQLQMIMDVVDDEENPFTEGAAEGSQYLITGVFLEAATWENGALALTNQMLNRLPTVRITWLVEGSQVRAPQAYRRLASRCVLLCCVPHSLPMWDARKSADTCVWAWLSQDLSDRVELPVYLNVTRKQLVTTGLVKGPAEISSGIWYQRGTSIQLWRQV